MNVVKIRMTFAFALVLAMTATGLWAAGAEEEAPTAAADKQYVTDPTTGKVVTAPEYGGTLNTWFTDFPGEVDTYFGWVDPRFSGVVEKLGIGDWGIDRDVYDFSNDGPLLCLP